MTERETELLRKINTRLPPEIWRRYDILYARMRARKISPQKHKELTDLIDVVEMDNAERVGYLVELMQLRQMKTLEEVMQTYGVTLKRHRYNNDL
jgi:PHP family Zn ribbon phosphoesterase